MKSPNQRQEPDAVTQKAAHTPPVSALLSDCVIDLKPDESAEVLFYVDREIMRRIKSRAQGQDLAQYIWLNIVRPALHGHVF